MISKIAPETFLHMVVINTMQDSDSAQDERKKSLFFCIYFMQLTVFSWLLFPHEARSSRYLLNFTDMSNSTCFSTTRHYKTRVLTSLWMITWITFAAGHEWQCKIRELLKQTACLFQASLRDHQPQPLRAFLPAHAPSAALANHSLDTDSLYKEPVENYLVYIFSKSHSLIIYFLGWAAHGSRRSQHCGWCGVRGIYGFGRGEWECNSPTWGQFKLL